MTQSDTLREKASRYHLIADTILDNDASVRLHEAATILEQQAEGLDQAEPRSNSVPPKGRVS